MWAWLHRLIYGYDDPARDQAPLTDAEAADAGRLGIVGRSPDDTRAAVDARRRHRLNADRDPARLDHDDDELAIARAAGCTMEQELIGRRDHPLDEIDRPRTDPESIARHLTGEDGLTPPATPGGRRDLDAILHELTGPPADDGRQ